jgi:hypothetical protein
VNPNSFVRDLFPPKNEDDLFDGICHPLGRFIPDSLFEPVIKTKVFINQKTPH